MSAFSADWLALREPADSAARSLSLTRTLARTLANHGMLSILDLGSGTGANVRYLAPLLPAEQRWLLVDHDVRLLTSVPERLHSWGAAHGYAVERDGDDVIVHGPRTRCRLSLRRADLQADADQDALYEGRHLVTASALLDLVSASWIESLAACCARSRTSVLFALTYDGRIACSPTEPEDEAIRVLVNEHQRTDKGFGTAAGPDAADIAHECFTRAGYDVWREPSDWVLTPDARDLQRQLIDGWADAAAAIAPEQSTMIGSWRLRRLEHVDSGRSCIRVGHTDIAAKSTFHNYRQHS